MSGCLILAAFSLQKSKFKKTFKRTVENIPPQKKKKTFKADWDSLISLWASRSQIEAPKAHNPPRQTGTVMTMVVYRIILTCNYI